MRVWQVFMIGVCLIAMLFVIAYPQRTNRKEPEPVKIHSNGSVGSGSLIRNMEGEPRYVVTSIHAVGIPMWVEIEMQDGTKRRAMLEDRIVLRVVEE